MKELFQGILALIGSLIVSVFLIPLGFVYSLLYAVWLSITLKDAFAFFKFIWRMIDGVAAAIGHFLYYGIGYSLDLVWNVFGELIEDFITAEENTTFNQKNISVSASVGGIEIKDKLNKNGKFLSKVLNIAFNQKQHATDAWNYTKERKTLKAKYFKKRKNLL